MSELTAQALYDWATTEPEEEYEYGEWPEDISELTYGSYESPWGKVEAVGGSDFSYGDGHETGFVVTVADRFFRFSGTYSSWDSTEYDEPVEVVPVPFTGIRFARADAHEKVFEDPTLS